MRFILINLMVLLFAESAFSATLTGTVTWSNPQEPKPALIATDRHICEHEERPIYESEVRHDRGRLEGVVVYVDAISPAKRLPKQRVVVDQIGCRFVPSVLVMTAGSHVRFRNSDSLLHSVRVLDSGDRVIANYVMPVRGQTSPKLRLKQPGIYRAICPASHSWMKAHLLVFDHPLFTITSSTGSFTIDNVPTGRHQVVAWHPELGKKTVTLTIDSRAGNEFLLHISY